MEWDQNKLPIALIYASIENDRIENAKLYLNGTAELMKFFRIRASH